MSTFRRIGPFEEWITDWIEETQSFHTTDEKQLSFLLECVGTDGQVQTISIACQDGADPRFVESGWDMAEAALRQRMMEMGVWED